MTTAREPQRDRDARDVRDLEPELDAEVINDLDPPSDDADKIKGGFSVSTCVRLR
jgi:hypothetical protein